MSRLQLVVPCYNEASRLEQQPFLKLVAANRDVTLVFVNDGSTDGTAAILADLAAGGGNRIRVMTLASNVGKARAVQQGILAALEDGPAFVGYWDADLSTPLDELHPFIDIVNTHPDVDIVMGSRVKMLGRRIERRPARHYAGRLFATAASLALGLAVYDTQCGAKLFRVNDTLRFAFTPPFRSPWVMDVEILARYIARLGRREAAARTHEVPLQAWRDIAGSKLRLGASLGAARDLFGIWKELRGTSGKG